MIHGFSLTLLQFIFCIPPFIIPHNSSQQTIYYPPHFLFPPYQPDYKSQLLPFDSVKNSRAVAFDGSHQSNSPFLNISFSIPLSHTRGALFPYHRLCRPTEFYPCIRTALLHTVSPLSAVWLHLRPFSTSAR